MSDREQRDGGRSAENNKNNRGGNGRVVTSRTTSAISTSSAL